jgi:uncharacterized membrane protein YgcG
MLRIGLVAAAAALAAPAWGQTALAPVLERLESQGYGGFEVENERGTLKVEAVKNGVERELRYDAATGKLLSDTQSSTDNRGGPVATGQYSRLYDTLTAAGFSNIKIEQEGGRIEVDAVKGGVERDLTYSASTGALISSRLDDDGDDRGRDDRDDRADDDDDRDDRADRDDDRDDQADRDDDDRGRGGRDDDDRDDDDDDDDRGGRGGSGGGSSGSSGSSGSGGGDGRGGSGGDDDDDDDRDDD